MKSLFTTRACGIALGSIALLLVSTAVLAVGNSLQVSGTIYGTYDYTFEGTGAWVGYAVLAVDGKVATAEMADRNLTHGSRGDGSIYGTEAVTLTFVDGSGTVEIHSQYDGIPASTPGLYTLHEVGTFANGTGKWANASGQVTVTGPFVRPHSEIFPGAPPWIAEIHGVISGVE
jgi:hypothetical protein